MALSIGSFINPGGDSTDNTYYTIGTTTATVTNASLLVLSIYSIGATAPPAPTIVTNNSNVVFDLVDTVTYGVRSMSTYRAMPVQNIAAGLLVQANFGAFMATGIEWVCTKITGASTAGHNGAGAIAQITKGGADTNATSLTLTHAANTSSVRNCSLAIFGYPLNSTANVSMTGLNGGGILANVGQASPNMGMVSGVTINTGGIADPKTPVGVSLGTNSVPRLGIMLEIAQAAVQPNGAIADNYSGDPTYNSGNNYTSTGERIVLRRIMARESGYFQNIEVADMHMMAAGTIDVRPLIYLDNAGVPGDRIMWGNSIAFSRTATGLARYSFSGSQTYFTKGQYYWVGLSLNDTSNLGVYFSSSGTGTHYERLATGQHVNPPTNGSVFSSVAKDLDITLKIRSYVASSQNSSRYRKRIKINRSAMPSVVSYNSYMALNRILVDVTDTDLKSTENGGKVHNLKALYSTLGASLDIAFVDIDGNTLNYEIQTYDATTGRLQAEVLLQSSSPAGEIFLTYGRSWLNSGDNGGLSDPYNLYAAITTIKGIWTMSDIPDSGTGSQLTKEIIDYKSNGNAGSVGMTSANSVAGLVGKALTFNGSSQYLEAAYNANLAFTNQYMVLRARIKFTSFPAYQTVIAQGNGAFRVDNQAGVIKFNLVKYGIVDQYVTWPGATTGTWYTIVAYQTPTAVYYYANGVFIGQFNDASQFTASTSVFRIGADAGTAQNYLSATVDEVSFSIKNGYSADEALIDYTAHHSPGTFTTVGAEEDGMKLYKVNGNLIPSTSATNSKGWSMLSGGEGYGANPQTIQSIVFDNNSFKANVTNYDPNYFYHHDVDFSALTAYSLGFVGGADFGVQGDLNMGTMLDTSNLTVEINAVKNNATYDLKNKTYDGIWIYAANTVAAVPGTVNITGNLDSKGRLQIQSATVNLTGKTIVGNYVNFYGSTSGSPLINLTNATITIKNRTNYNGNVPELALRNNGITTTNTAVIFDNDGFTADDKYLYTSALSLGSVRIMQGSLDWWFNAPGAVVGTLTIDPGAWLKVEPDPATINTTSFLSITTALNAVGTSGNRVKLTNYDAGVVAYLAPSGTPTINVDYADITDLGVNGATWLPGHNSTPSGTTTGWAFDQTVQPGTIDNTEVISGDTKLNIVIAPGTIARTSTVDGIYAISNYTQYVVPDNIATVQFGDLFISNYRREILVDTIGSTTIVTDPYNVFNKTTYLYPSTIVDTTTVTLPTVAGQLAPNDTSPSYDFYAKSVRNLRDISGAVLISFERQYDADAELFTVGSSAFDMGAVWRGNGTTIQEWDKFDYTDYTEYLSGFEYHVEQDIIGGMVLGMADITFNNFSNIFSPYGSSPIAPYILPNRPIRLYAGYKQTLEQLFVGQTMRLPDTTRETAKFHALDFIGSFADIELTAGRTYVNVYTDDIVDDLLQNVAGLSPVQYSLDTGLNLIGFINFPKGTKVGEALRQLMQAELGRLYQASDGALVFNNRTNKTRPTAITLREEYIYSEKEPNESNVINRVKINADRRVVQTSRQVYPKLKSGSLTTYEDFQSFQVPANSSVDKFFNFADPVTTLTHPTVGGGITANSASDGSGANRNADLTRTIAATFTDSVKYTFTNTSATDLYVTACTISGTPATVVEEIRIDLKDQPSIDKYGEKLITLDNDCFTSKTFATTIAQSIIDQNKEAPSIREMTVKGLPYMHVGDVIKHYDGNNYVIDLISGKHSPDAGHIQTIRARRTA